MTKLPVRDIMQIKSNGASRFEERLFCIYSFKGGITMAAFDRICSGIPEMDTALDNIRLGDNVVWRVSELLEFKLFMQPHLSGLSRS